MECRYCNGKTIKKGYDKKKRQKYKCKSCGKMFTIVDVFDEKGMLIPKVSLSSKGLNTTYNLL